jgi:hypothetical protein
MEIYYFHNPLLFFLAFYRVFASPCHPTPPSAEDGPASSLYAVQPTSDHGLSVDSLALFAEDLQHKSFSGSVSKYRSNDKCHPHQSNYPTEDPFNEKTKDYQYNSYD